MGFSFKQFQVDDNGCGMPVSTDGVLLGAWAPLQAARNILDIGAGSGLLSLMAAQRSDAVIDAVELDAQAATICQGNFSASRWCDRLHLYQSSIQQFNGIDGGYDHILCNPPYFEHGPKSSSVSRAAARHTQHLNFTELAQAIARLLQPEGVASLILPVASIESLRQQLQSQGLLCLQQTLVSARPDKSPNRCLLLIGWHTVANLPLSGPLWIREADGQYSAKMRQLTQDFYLKL
ncbi:methyltransferase [Shewanella yunxiaonensis]|uniref:tRNA1(Val) (adenine(37)-N6)-methyltransferase n=1 Tax=Shewanella yunxiaonensis TaxID=2829809 RepID=A0ABX7YSW0_9GAMM|nr:methyltransferase [Shewanella yunxiaonensis]QUN05201.1 methyltransferase [Shewanella yunxiaonensis]